MKAAILSLTAILVLVSGRLGLAADLPMGPIQSPLNNLPELGSTANAMVGKQEEYQVGRMIVKNLRDDNQILEDPEVTEYIQSIGSRIASQAQDGNQNFQFFVVRDPQVNAFALPGGFIGINSGLYTLTTSESQLGSVLAHEAAHVSQRHIARAVQAQSRQSLSTMAAVLGAILIGAAAGGDAAGGLIAIAQGTAMQQQINFTRMEESEADRVGIAYLAAAGYDPGAMPEFFSTMGRIDSLGNKDIPELLLSHPVTTLRIAETRARAAQIGQVKHSDTLGYSLIRERIRVVAYPDTDQRPYYERMRANGDNSLAVRYGSALADLKAGQNERAVGELRELLARNPNITLLHAALGQAQMAAGDNDAALATFARANSLFPRNVPIGVRYGEALIKADKPQKAHQLLLDLFNNVTPTPEQINLTALAASAAGETGDAYYYMSEYHIASGALGLATQQLELALAAPKLTPVQRKRFQARLEEIRGYLREQRRPRTQQANSGG
ncbi:MAG: M48 family metalloprotease [Steroidobacteraceae bacterium]